ncbi:N-acetylmuramoyl-L-alanine amidase [Nocardia huaxiensis]|uniref:N-acetylmuramoyl-L-alanine amidase n=1 Tax=Nocardia huaxiensis TaxID=2755382 RepID=A0A7D6V9K4_9NOCA|nr:N-acetylmuramoyl-L-alanine amidase [Nocardia huaxiensis]QLY31152.1 N-acetylmuramoyl-L-alanine amidase [Nocardia huaxiensis]UFS94683.1 N-acetylmuramoyl-L-alanine amidase [Nocardia huaxiensis]
MPYQRRKPAYVLPVVTALAITAPLGVLALSDSPDIRNTDESNLAAIPAKMTEVVLASSPDIVLPLRELTGLNLPDLRLSDLRMIPLPKSVRVPQGLPLPPGVQLPAEIPLPNLQGTTTAPASFDSAGPFTAAPGFIARRQPGDENLPAPADPGVSPADPGATPADPNVPATDPAAGTPTLPELTGDPSTPALSPGAVPRDMIDKVGAQVKELTRDTPFSMVALTADSLAGRSAMIRAQRPDGSWGPWYPAEQADGRAQVKGKTGTEPVYVGNTKSVQVLVTKQQAAAPTDGVPAEPGPLTPDSTDPAQINLEKLAAVLIDPGRGAIDENLSQVASSLPGGGPKVITRAQWGADESLRCEEPTYDDGVSAITVHHTAGRNDYSKAESAGIVRAIYAYHAKTLGWCDIGYNALVDKYGQIFEGRYGGLDRPVEGAHAGGFNINTAGVAFMGNHEEEAPTDVAVQSMGQFIGWRARTAGIDPEGSTTMYSEGSEYTRYAMGQAVKLPNVFAHRDVGNTTCPGDAAYSLMDRIREIAEGVAGPSPATSSPRTRPDVQVNHQNPGATTPDTDTTGTADAELATLAELTTRLLGLLDKSAVARYYSEQGGPNGPLGQVKSEPQPTADGGQTAGFVNGYVYASPTGQVYAVVGKILERFLQLGAGTGVLGLPQSNEYRIQDGIRSDFQNGSLIYNTVTGIVTTVLKNFGTGAGTGAGTAPNARVNPGAATTPGAGVTPGGPGTSPGAGAPGAATVPGAVTIPEVMGEVPAAAPIPEAAPTN